MNEVNKKALVGFLKMLIILPSLVFLSAWTIDYWQAWICLSVFFGCVIAITLYLMKADPRLLERRVAGGASAEKETSQKIIQTFAAAVFVSVFVFPALDHRFAWSAVPAFAVIAGDLFIVLGFLIVYFVFKVNTYTSGIIEVADEQRVISQGPYALVRHPMYSGALVMLFGIPLALGSWRGMLTIVPMTLVIVWRLLDEEKFLDANLPGYSEYRVRVRYRLAPYFW